MTTVDLNHLPAPAIIETLDYEQILAELKQSLLDKDPDLVELLTLESEPLVKLLEICAYRELLLRQKINDSAKSVMLAFAEHSDLDHLSALLSVRRQESENDDQLRARTQLSPESYSTAGPAGAYQFHTYSVDSSIIDVSVEAPIFSHGLETDTIHSALPHHALTVIIQDDVGLENPLPGDVAITVLFNHTVNPEEQAVIIDQVTDYLHQDHIRPLTDRPRVRAAELINYQVIAEVEIIKGPEGELALRQAKSLINNYITSQYRLGATIYLSALYAALQQPGIINVNLIEPTSNIICRKFQAPYCSNIQVSHHDPITD